MHTNTKEEGAEINLKWKTSVCIFRKRKRKHYLSLAIKTFSFLKTFLIFRCWRLGWIWKIIEMQNIVGAFKQACFANWNIEIANPLKYQGKHQDQRRCNVNATFWSIWNNCLKKENENEVIKWLTSNYLFCL